jgi:hypothetical protein
MKVIKQEGDAKEINSILGAEFLCPAVHADANRLFVMVAKSKVMCWLRSIFKLITPSSIF